MTGRQAGPWWQRAGQRRNRAARARAFLAGGNFELRTFGNGPERPSRRRGGEPDDPLAQLGEAWRRLRERQPKRFCAEGAQQSRKIRSAADKRVQILLAGARNQAEIVRGEGDARAVRVFAGAYTRA